MHLAPPTRNRAAWAWIGILLTFNSVSRSIRLLTSAGAVLAVTGQSAGEGARYIAARITGRGSTSPFRARPAR